MNATFQLQMLSTISLIPHNSDPDFDILIIELNNTFFFLLNLNTLREGTNHDTCCLSNHCPDKRALDKTWLTNSPNWVWDHCSSAIPGQGIESLLPTFGVPLIPSIIRTEEEQTAAGTRCNSPTYIIHMHL